MNMRPVALMDLDGVIADARWRLHFIGVHYSEAQEDQELARNFERSSAAARDWDKFYSLVGSDPVLATGKDLALSLAVRCDIVYLTGRRESCRSDTFDWLRANGLPGGSMRMRRNHDYRPASIVKPEVVASLPPSRIMLVVDDDPLVCDAFAALGYPVLQATWAQTRER